MTTLGAELAAVDLARTHAGGSGRIVATPADAERWRALVQPGTLRHTRFEPERFGGLPLAVAAAARQSIVRSRRGEAVIDPGAAFLTELAALLERYEATIGTMHDDDGEVYFRVDGRDIFEGYLADRGAPELLRQAALMLLAPRK